MCFFGFPSVSLYILKQKPKFSALKRYLCSFYGGIQRNALYLTLLSQFSSIFFSYFFFFFLLQDIIELLLRSHLYFSLSHCLRRKERIEIVEPIFHSTVHLYYLRLFYVLRPRTMAKLVLRKRACSGWEFFFVIHVCRISWSVAGTGFDGKTRISGILFFSLLSSGFLRRCRRRRVFSSSPEKANDNSVH